MFIEKNLKAVRASYIVTLAYLSGDHCRVLGIYDDKDLALKHLREVDAYESCQKFEAFVEMVQINKSCLNTRSEHELDEVDEVV